MENPKFSRRDFEFSPSFLYKDVAVVNHLEISEDNRRQGFGSVIIETLKRVAFCTHDVSRIVVEIGGEEETEQFLESNGFYILYRNYYSKAARKYLKGDFSVRAEFRKDWIPDDK